MTNVNTLIEGAKELNLELNPEQIQKFISYKKNYYRNGTRKSI